MNPPADQTAELDYLLGVSSGPAPSTSTAELVPPVASVPPVQLSTAVAPGVASVGGSTDVALAVQPSQSEGAPATTTTPTLSSSAAPPAGAAGDTGAPNSKKRPLEDKKARDRKRVLRNRELARVSNERRKGRIKAMENELTETRQTVSTLEESIRCLEAENQELRNLLQGKPDGTASGAPPVAQPPVAPQ